MREREYFRYLVRKYFPSSPSSNGWVFGKYSTQLVLTEMEIFQSGERSLWYLLGTALWSLGVSNLFPLRCDSLLVSCLLQSTVVLSWPWRVSGPLGNAVWKEFGPQCTMGMWDPDHLCWYSGLKYCDLRPTAPLWKEKVLLLSRKKKSC